MGSRILLEYMGNPRVNMARMPKDIDGVSLRPIGLASARELYLDFDIGAPGAAARA